MSATSKSGPAQTRYCTLYRIGYWGSLEAKCRTEPCAEFDQLIDHKVTFVLINGFGDRCEAGYSIITGQTDRSEVFDEDGDTFPDLETAVRSHAVDPMNPDAGETDRLVSTRGKAQWRPRSMRDHAAPQE